MLPIILLTGCLNQVDNSICSNRIGSYRISYKQLDGNCGELNDIIVSVDHQLTPDDLSNRNCTGSVSYSADNCKVSYVDVMCQPGDVTQNAEYMWNADGTVGVGTASFRLSYCFSTYQVLINLI